MQRAPNLYRDKAINKVAIEQIRGERLPNKDEAIDKVAVKVMQVLVVVAANVQSRRGRIVPPREREQALRFAYNHITAINQNILKRIHFGHDN